MRPPYLSCNYFERNAACVRYEPDKILDQGEAAFPLRKANGLLRLSGASLISLVQSPDLWNRYHAPLFRWFHCPGLRGVFAQGQMHT